MELEDFIGASDQKDRQTAVSVFVRYFSPVAAKDDGGDVGDVGGGV